MSSFYHISGVIKQSNIPDMAYLVQMVAKHKYDEVDPFTVIPTPHQYKLDMIRLELNNRSRTQTTLGPR